MVEHIGGQAVIEGVMMRSPTKLAVSVRLPNNKIKTKKERLKKNKYAKWPFFRGAVILIDTLVKGTKVLLWSADQQLDEHEKITKRDVFLTLFFTFSITLLFFVALPYVLAIFSGVKEEVNPILFNLIDGVIKIVLFLGYVIGISFMKDIRRVFQYHGAEHKAVHCYEAGKKLTVANAKKFTTLHTRCGTSFLIIVLMISILVFSILPILVISVYSGFLDLGFWLQKGILFPLRILLIPFIAAISYEVLKASDKYSKFKVLKLITMPGLLVQKITTKEPSNKQIEVAIKSLKEVL
ncbi:DUF1385 domain-containing protein [Candidatus Woesearchaeota archaeon]|nr:DUF1385 domain-containing protein [Candidatus Woesearchaeota archaeon]